MPNNRRHSTFEVATTAILTLCAVVVTILLVKKELSSTNPTGSSLQPEFRSDWRGSMAGGTMKLGTPGGPITVVEFLDFRCPFCAAFAATLDSLMALHPGEVDAVLRNFPLTMHPFSETAARAGICAGEQGSFEVFYDSVFMQSDSVWALVPADLAPRLGLRDSASFVECMASRRPRERVVADSLEGVRLGLKGVPLMIVDGWVFRGAPALSDLLAVLNREPVE